MKFMKMKISTMVALIAILAQAGALVRGLAPSASVTTNGVTTLYSTLTNAWTDACAAQRTGVDATVKMLKDATVDETLETGFNAALTLYLNDCVLGYAGKPENCIVQLGGGTLHVVDTSVTRTPRYFACDPETGLLDAHERSDGSDRLGRHPHRRP